MSVTETSNAASVAPVAPTKLTILAALGQLGGSNERYEKFLPDLEGAYLDAEAFAALAATDSGAPLYWVESSHTEDGVGALIIGTSVVEPGLVGDEYAMTRGHIHAQADRSELYLGVSGRGVMLLETVDGRSEAIEITAGEIVYVPGYWVHRSVNVGPERLVMLFCYGADAGQDYGIIERAGGMQQLVVGTPDGGWETRPNPRHRGYHS
jgi:glucose-6-phosphate isomerase